MLTKFSALFMTLIMSFFSLFGTDLNYKYRVPSPDIEGNYRPGEVELVKNADYYISVSGSDDNAGSYDAPFATFEKAMEAVKNTDKSGKSGITVAVMAGEYRVHTLEFTLENGGTEDCPVKFVAYGNGEAIINGGATLNTSGFRKVQDEAVLKRLSKKAKDKVLCYDLSADGITKENYGKIYAIGTYNTAYKYTGDNVGPLYCELFVNDKRMTIARYPDEGFLYTEEVVSTGEGLESNGSLTKNPDWDKIVNPESDVYKISKSLADRINSWETLDDVWMFGFWKYDWADASSSIGSFDYESRTISPEFVSLYGTKEDAPYYFFNVFEELDNPGEWYLDREKGIIYLYPTDDFGNSSVDLSLSTGNIIRCVDCSNITFEGFTIKGTRGDAVDVSGNNVTIKGCIIKNVAGYAINAAGSNILVTDCEITRTGKGGIRLAGGDRETLTPGNNIADNNLIHDWSEIFQTYQPAVTLEGVGNICSHNEIFNSPHEAIAYSGNNHLIEYNIIHDVCLLSDDAGAIYSGRRWDWYGTVIRYNCIYNLGSDGHKPNGIYFDDALSGQTAYGNILINIPQKAFHLGGGRDLTVKNNIIINAGENAVSYDQRAIDGIYGGWYDHSANINSSMWQNLYNSPWQNEIWQEAYPQMKSFSSDFDNPDDPGFIPNPANSEVKGNVIFSLNKSIGSISEKADKYSDISGNAVYGMMKLDDIFVNPYEGDYSLKENCDVYKQIPEFEALPLEEFGRY